MRIKATKQLGQWLPPGFCFNHFSEILEENPAILDKHSYLRVPLVFVVYFERKEGTLLILFSLHFLTPVRVQTNISLVLFKREDACI